MLIDTHCHLDDTSLAPRLPEVLAAARLAGVVKYIIPGVSPAGWDDITPLARREEGIFAAFGLHPMRTNLYTSGMLVSLAKRLPGAVAVGEIGLDYLYADQQREKQQEAFRAQLRLAVEAGLPVLIHCRKAFRDLLTILREEDVAKVGGVMHAFSGSPEIAWECIDLNLCISVAGPVTWHNAIRPVEVVRRVPLEHLLLETDAPDLAPEPLRGQTNEPAFLVETARRVAELKGMTIEEVARVTTANAERLFRLK